MLPWEPWEAFGNIFNFRNFYLFDFKDINPHPSAPFRVSSSVAKSENRIGVFLQLLSAIREKLLPLQKIF